MTRGIFTICATSLVAATVSIIDIRPAVSTDPLAADPDDPAIWVNSSDPQRSLVVGTIKVRAPAGGLAVFSLDGKLKQNIEGLDRPNNVDIEYGLRIGGKPVDIAVTTERLKRQLRVYAVSPDGLKHLSAIPVFAGQKGDEGAPMGIALYKRPRDGAIFAIVSRKEGPATGYLWQYRLQDDGAGGVRATKVREFGNYRGGLMNEIEAVAVDDELGYVYYADERAGIRKYHADPEHPEGGRELALFGEAGFSGDREGIAIYAGPGGTGYVVCTDQNSGNSSYHVYRRQGAPGRPHDHSERVLTFRGGADSTDGVEITSTPLGPRFPKGVMVAMNSGPKNFLIFDWTGIGRALGER